MNKVLFPKKDYVKELVRIFKLSKNSQKLVKTLSKYHEKDIAEAITLLTPAERQHIYNIKRRGDFQTIHFRSLPI